MSSFLFVNASHPLENHVSALRVASFARALVRQGHDVYLLTRPPSVEVGMVSTADRVASKSRQLNSWHILEQPPSGGQLLQIDAEGIVPDSGGLVFPLIRRARTAVNWLRGCSSDPVWVRSADEILSRVLANVDIDLVWATFTPIESWTIGARFAEKRGIPFVADIKDDWGHYVPAGLRRIVARRFRKVAGLTANSSRQWDNLPLKHDRRAVIYSGIWRERLPVPRVLMPLPRELTAVFFGRVVASEYRPLLEYLHSWASTRNQKIQIKYFGSRRNEIERLAGELGLRDGIIRCTATAYIAPDRLNGECADADFNFYARVKHVAIHHKATELMAASRPILVWGAETTETHELSQRVGVPMLSCKSEEEVFAALDAWFLIGSNTPREISKDDRDWLTWEQQAALLLRFFEQVVLSMRMRG